MPSLIRRVRAALSLAAFWGVAAGAIGLLLGVWQGVRISPYPVLPDIGQWWFERHTLVVGMTVTWAAAGAIIGLGFAGLLGRVEHGRNPATLSPARFSLWGGLAGGGVFAAWWVATTQLRNPGSAPVGFPVMALASAIALGAGCAWVTLRLSQPHSDSRPLQTLEPTDELSK